jgi:hypothetical protein
MNDDSLSRRGASMTDRELPKRAQEARCKPETVAPGTPHRPVPAVGYLLDTLGALRPAANRGTITVQQLGSGEFPLYRIDSLNGLRL